MTVVVAMACLNLGSYLASTCWNTGFLIRLACMQRQVKLLLLAFYFHLQKCLMSEVFFAFVFCLLVCLFVFRLVLDPDFFFFNFYVGI